MKNNPTPNTPMIPVKFGVNLMFEDERCVMAHPLPGPAPDLSPIPLPPLSMQHLTIWTGAMHGFWDHYHRPMAMLLFLDFAQHAWRAVVPSQHCAPSGSYWRLGEPENPWQIRATERLAGSFQSMFVDDPNCLIDHLPVFNGMHLVSDLTTGIAGVSLWAHLCSGCQAQMVDPNRLVHNDGWRWLQGVAERLRVIEEDEAGGER